MPESGVDLIPQQRSRPVYSASRLSTYESCPLQYRFRYIDRIPRADESIEVYLGLRVHEALNTLYRTLQHGGTPSLAELLNDYDVQWGRHWHSRIKIVKQDRSIEYYRGFGERCLVNYYQAHAPFTHGQVVGLEYQVATSLDPHGCYRIQGYIDRLVSVGSGCYEIHDYKTSGRLPSQGDLDVDRQLALYQLAVERILPDAKEVELVWHYLAFGKELRSRRTPNALERLTRSTIAVIDRIEADTQFRPIKSSLCHWCTYKNICPLWAKQSDPPDAPLSKTSGNGRSNGITIPEEREGRELYSIARDALREAIVVAAGREGIEIRFAEQGQLWISAAQLLSRTPLAKIPAESAVEGMDGWLRLSAESLPLLFRQVELARFSTHFVEKLQRYLRTGV